MENVLDNANIAKRFIFFNQKYNMTLAYVLITYRIDNSFEGDDTTIWMGSSGHVMSFNSKVSVPSPSCTHYIFGVLSWCKQISDWLHDKELHWRNIWSSGFTLVLIYFKIFYQKSKFKAISIPQWNLIKPHNHWQANCKTITITSIDVLPE